MRINEKRKEYRYHLSIRKRLIYSNVLMFLIPVAVTAVTAFIAFGIALYTFEHFYLPRMGLTMKKLHEMGEQYENDFKSFLILMAVLGLVMLALLLLSIVLTNRFLTRFVLCRVEEPLKLLSEGVSQIRSGRLDHTISYDRNDEFAPVCEAFNGMTERLRQSAEQSAAEEQRQRELFAGISHDLRSPLTSVRAYTEALLDGVAKTPEDTQRYLHKIRLHEAEIEHMVEALFLYSKMELKDYPVHLQNLNLQSELIQICANNPADCHLVVDLTDVQPLTVTADPFLLERIVQNLLDNSKKYRKGTLSHVRISAVPTDGGILLSVADDGIGVPTELLPRLFDPFYRTDPARSNPADGSGLGLAIVREAVLHLGGTVWAENVPDGGLDIKICLQEGMGNAKHPDH